MAADEPLGPLHEPDPQRHADADEHQRAEDVLDEPEPARAPDPRQGEVRVDDLAHRLGDRGEEHEEAPEDEGVHEAGCEPLEELALGQHVGALTGDPSRQVAASVHGPAKGVQTGEQARPAREQPAREEDDHGEEGAAHDHRARV